MDTIYALSSGSPPAGIAVIRISGSCAANALSMLAGDLPAPRRASARTLRDADKNPLDDALVLWLPGPGTATGEDVAELHLHGGRAVVSAVEGALGAMDGLRAAKPGEFTRRAFTNGRMDLAEAEGLADLLSAETELQRRTAMAMAGGTFSAQVEGWREDVLSLSAQVEAALDFSDEDDVSTLPESFQAQVSDFASELKSWLDKPQIEKLREGYRVVLAGPPNAGKSTLFNALLQDEAAITAPTAGTTRDILERAVSLDGIPFTFVDTAGLREGSEDAIEAIGIDRAHKQFELADLVLWLGPERQGPAKSIEIDGKCDAPEHSPKQSADVCISAKSGEGMDALRSLLLTRASSALPAPGSVALNSRQYSLIDDAYSSLVEVALVDDPLLVGEQLRLARLSFDRLIGRSSTEDMLDALFGRFCIGK